VLVDRIGLRRGVLGQGLRRGHRERRVRRGRSIRVKEYKSERVEELGRFGGVVIQELAVGVAAGDAAFLGG